MTRADRAALRVVTNVPVPRPIVLRTTIAAASLATGLRTHAPVTSLVPQPAKVTPPNSSNVPSTLQPHTICKPEAAGIP